MNKNPAVPDLSKVQFNPAESLTFYPVPKRQKCNVEITNNSTSCVLIKIRNTNPSLFSSILRETKIRAGERLVFGATFRGATKEELQKSNKFFGQKYTVVICAVPEHVNITPIKEFTATRKHKLQILFKDLNEEKKKEESEEPEKKASKMVPKPSSTEKVEDKDTENK